MQLQYLVSALNALGPTSWRDAALAALSSPGIVYKGSEDPSATAAAHELIPTYTVRLEHLRKQGIADIFGIAELLEALTKVPGTARLRLTPFIGPTSWVCGFWNDQGQLIGCISTLNHQPDRGRQNVAIAMGQRED